MVPYIPIREKYTNISRISFSFRPQMRGKNFSHAKTWEWRSKSRSYQLSVASRHSRSHIVFLLRACLHEGGVLQVGLAMLEKLLVFTNNFYNPRIPGWGCWRACKCNMNATLARRVTLLETFAWHIATLADRVTLPDRATSQGRLLHLWCKRDQDIIRDFIKDGAKRGKN